MGVGVFFVYRFVGARFDGVVGNYPHLRYMRCDRSYNIRYYDFCYGRGRYKKYYKKERVRR